MTIQVKKKEYVEYMDEMIQRQMAALDNQYKAVKKSPLTSAPSQAMMSDILDRLNSLVQMRQVAANSGVDDYIYFIDPTNGTVNRTEAPIKSVKEKCQAYISNTIMNPNQLNQQFMSNESEGDTNEKTRNSYVG